jgi:hypothetical protein
VCPGGERAWSLAGRGGSERTDVVEVVEDGTRTRAVKWSMHRGSSSARAAFVQVFSQIGQEMKGA